MDELIELDQRIDLMKSLLMILILQNSKKLMKNSDFHFNELQKNLIYINIFRMNISVTNKLI